MENLPSEIQWHIIKYMRHPAATIVRDSALFKYRFHKNNSYRNGAFDMGSRDAYYGRPKCPSIVTMRLRNSEGKYHDVRVQDLSNEDIEAYNSGYENEKERKW